MDTLCQQKLKPELRIVQIDGKQLRHPSDVIHHIVSMHMQLLTGRRIVSPMVQIGQQNVEIVCRMECVVLCDLTVKLIKQIQLRQRAVRGVQQMIDIIVTVPEYLLSGLKFAFSPSRLPSFSALSAC